MEIENHNRRVSYSQYAMWSTCPRQWKLTYVDKLKPKDNSIHLIFGTAIHETIQTWLELYYNGPKNKLKFFDVEDYFKERLFALFKNGVVIGEDEQKVYVCDRATLKEFYLDGSAILKQVIKHPKQYFPKHAGTKLIGCEVPLEVQLRPNVQFVGYIDLVIHHTRENRLIIYDFKTSGKGWFHEKKDPKKINQILLYKRFYSTMFDIPEEEIEVKFMILKRKVPDTSEYPISRVANFEPVQGVKTVSKAIDSFDNFVNTTFDVNGQVLIDNLIATPSAKNCKWCYFRDKKNICPDGIN